MPRLSILRNYYAERFTPVPWLILPFVMGFFLVGFNLSIFRCALFLLSGLLFFRLFDDLMMKSWDERSFKRRDYFDKEVDLKKLLVYPFSFYLFLTAFYLGIQGTVLTVFFILWSLTLYRWLLGKRTSLFISLLKYPFLCCLWMNSLQNPWPWVITSFFLAHELMSEKLLRIRPELFYGFVTLILGVKIFLDQN